MDQTTFTDILQKSFVAMSMGSTDRITTINILSNLLVSFLVGMFIYYIYKKTYQGVLYQRSFNISIVLVCCVTSLVIMTISGNLILSLGMVGALSIVRFRTPIKDSMDLIFLFWAISTGLANGVGYYNISIIGSIMIALFMLFLTRKQSTTSDSYILVVTFPESSNEKSVLDEVKAHTSLALVKSKSVNDNGVEITLEIKALHDDTSFLNKLQEQNIITRATIITYEQDLSSV